MTKRLVFVTIVTFLSFAAAIEKLKVTVYYESLCPFSTDFIRKEIWPAYKKIGERLVVDLVPHGHSDKEESKTDGVMRFKCQHGQWECFGNKVQTCVVHSDVEEKTKLGYVECVMGKTKTEDYEGCADKWNINSEQLSKCYEGSDIESWQDENNKRTKELIPSFSTSVPFVIFNDQSSHELNHRARNDFLNTACGLLSDKPVGCED